MYFRGIKANINCFVTYKHYLKLIIRIYTWMILIGRMMSFGGGGLCIIIPMIWRFGLKSVEVSAGL